MSGSSLRVIELVIPNQYLRGHPKFLVQGTDLSERQASFFAQNIMNALAGTADVDRKLLADEIRLYDDQIDRGPAFHNDDQLRRIAHARQYRGDRVRTCKFAKIDDSKGRPLIAIREFIVTRKSLGGIQTDLSSRVLDNNGEVLPGLYAVGEAAGFGGGGIHGLRSLEGTFLGGCIFSGRLAGQAIGKG
jgi:predicted oxidoreductase